VVRASSKIGVVWRPCDPRPQNPEQLRDGWVELLGRKPWEWFVTLTFREDRVHEERAEKSFRYWVAQVNNAAFGRRWRRQGKGVLWARATEWQRRGSVHFHALVAGGVGHVKRLALMKEWEDIAGWARIRPVRRQDLVAKYVTKYVAKGGDIEVGGPWNQPAPEAELL
jgi:hypothetical protein